MTLDNLIKDRTEENTVILGGGSAPLQGNKPFKQNLTAEFHPSAHCNFHCPHCQGQYSKKGDMMSEKIIDDFFNSYDNRPDHEIGIWRVIISGICGEPLINKDMTTKIIKEARKRKISFGLATSGYLLDHELITELTTDPVYGDWICFSIDGALGKEERLQNMYCQSHGINDKNIFKKVIYNIEMLNEAKSTKYPILLFDWIISDLNIDPNHIQEDLISTVKYLNDLSGVNLLRLQFPFRFYDSIPELSIEQNESLENALREVMKMEVRDDFVVMLRNNWIPKINRITKCNAVTTYGPVISPNGSLYNCPYLASPEFANLQPNLKDINLKNYWEKIKVIPELDLLGIDKCQKVCTYRDVFLKDGIVR